MKIIRLLLALFLLGAVNVSQAATLTVYTNKANWIANVASFDTENFDDAILNPGVQVTSDAGSVNVGLGVWDDILQPAGTIQETTFSFDPALLAFGGDWDLTPGGGGPSGIRVTLTLINQGTQVLTEKIDQVIQGGYFFGFTSDVAFTDVLLQADDVINAESFYLDDMVYEQQIVSNPIPATVWLFGTGLFGLLGWSRKANKES